MHARSYSYAGKHSTQIFSIRGGGLSQGKKFTHNIREACESKVQVRKPSFLVPWILRGHSRKEYGGNKGIHPKSDKRGLGI